MFSHSVMSDFLQLYRLQPTRLLCPWDSPSKHTGVGCHFLLQGIFLTQGLNLSLLLQADSLLSEPPGASRAGAALFPFTCRVFIWEEFPDLRFWWPYFDRRTHTPLGFSGHLPGSREGDRLFPGPVLCLSFGDDGSATVLWMTGCAWLCFCPWC